MLLYGHAGIPLPGFFSIYVARTHKSPKTTVIIFTFPDGQIAAELTYIRDLLRQRRGEE